MGCVQKFGEQTPKNAHLEDQEDGWIIFSAVRFQKQAL
jgi:hypothetical protein